jgi:hypothetical protein
MMMEKFIDRAVKPRPSGRGGGQSEEMYITPASVTKMIDPIFFIVMGRILRFILIVMDLRAVGIASTQM